MKVKRKELVDSIVRDVEQQVTVFLVKEQLLSIIESSFDGLAGIHPEYALSVIDKLYEMREELVIAANRLNTTRESARQDIEKNIGNFIEVEPDVDETQLSQ